MAASSVPTARPGDVPHDSIHSRTRAAVALASFAAVALLAGGCGGEDGITSSRAKLDVNEAGKSFVAAFDRPGVPEISSPWKASIKMVPDTTCATDQDGRWRLSGAVTVADRTDDGDGAITLLLGFLPDTWDTQIYVGDLDDDPSLVEPLTYGKGADAVQAEVTILPAKGGWTYALSARSACIKQ